MVNPYPYPFDAIAALWGWKVPSATDFDKLEAEARALKLLRSWLSPAQLREFDKHHAFTVVGSHTGFTYRVHAVVNYNVVDEFGKVWCFQPAPSYPNSPIYDVMLAQKIALEVNEEEALRVANRRQFDWPGLPANELLPADAAPLTPAA